MASPPSFFVRLAPAMAAFVFALAAVPFTVVAAQAPAHGKRALSCAQLLSRLHNAPVSTQSGRTGAEALSRRQLVDAILDTPGCGKVQGVLLQVQPVEGVNFYDYRDPVGTSARHSPAGDKSSGSR